MTPKTEHLRALLVACVCLLVWVAAGLAVSGSFGKVLQAAAVLAAARVAGLSCADCGFQRPKRGALPPVLCFAAFAAAFELLFPAQNAELASAESPAALLRVFVSVCILAPLAEELAFRGVIQNTLRPYGAAGVVLQAAAFALMHGTLLQKFYALIMGVLLGWLARRTESVWPGVVLHAANNILTFILTLWRCGR